MTDTVQSKEGTYRALYSQNTWQLYLVYYDKEGLSNCCVVVAHDELEARDKFKQTTPGKEPKIIRHVPLESDGFFILRTGQAGLN